MTTTVTTGGQVSNRTTGAGTRPRPARGWWSPARPAQILTAMTLLAMLVGLALEWRAVPRLWSNLAYAVAYIAGGYYGVRAGWQSLRARRIDVDLLMVLAAAGAALVDAAFEGAMLLFLFSLSNVLQSYALDRTRNAIRALIALRPETALIRRNGDLVTVHVDEVVVDDVMILRPGERIPLDGQVIAGASSVDQSPLTGESLPISRAVGDPVLAGTINQQGGLEVRVSRLAGDSTLARLIALVEVAREEKAATQRFIDRAEQYYALGVIILTAAAILLPPVALGEAWGTAFYRAMTLMVAASPCALVISTPATVLSAIAAAARRGVLFKGGVYVERAAGIKVMAFDKTGTLTVGRPQVTAVRALDAALDDAGVLALAGAVEAKSEHPLAEAIVRAARAAGVELAEADYFQSATGLGVTGQVNGRRVLVGNRRMLAAEGATPGAATDATVAEMQDAGQTAVVVAVGEPDGWRPVGVIGVADVLRPGVAAVLARLKELGVARTVMLTGDNQRVAEAIARAAGIDEVHANLMPADKLDLLRQFSAETGPVAMIGDGVNDAPALAAADIGIAMGAAGTDVALETADVVLMGDDLSQLPYVLALSRATRRTLTQNLAFALLVIVVLIGAVLGFSLALPLSVLGHEGSTVLVSLNGLRLLAFRPDGQ